MKKISTLGYALLSLLARQEASGYDLARQMQRPVGFFWQANHSQIYPELAKLEVEQCIAHTTIEQEDRPDKKVYRITEAGKAALEIWLITATPDVPIRNEQVLKSYGIWLADPYKAREIYRQYAREHDERCRGFEQILADLQEQSDWPPALSSPLFGSYVVLERGIREEGSARNWCNWVVDQLEHGFDQQ